MAESCSMRVTEFLAAPNLPASHLQVLALSSAISSALHNVAFSTKWNLKTY